MEASYIVLRHVSTMMEMLCAKPTLVRGGRWAGAMSSTRRRMQETTAKANVYASCMSDVAKGTWFAGGMPWRRMAARPCSSICVAQPMHNSVDDETKGASMMTRCGEGCCLSWWQQRRRRSWKAST